MNEIDSLMRLVNVDYYFQDGDKLRYILKDINIQFNKGKLYSIVGQSGSGKTTLLSLLGYLDTPKFGDIYIQNKNLNQINQLDYRKNHIGIVFQNYNLIPYMTGLENVLLNMTDSNIEMVYNLLDYLGIDKLKANRKITKLSGGEQQRVAIARALANEADIILADEPTGNLDSQTETEIFEIFKNLAHQYNKCVIVVTHSADFKKYSDEVWELKNKKISCEYKV